MTTREPHYLPQYFITVSYYGREETELYHGSILWSGNWPQSSFVEPFPVHENEESVYQVNFEPDNQWDAKEMELGYAASKYLIKGTDSKLQGFYIGRNGELVSEVQNYEQSYVRIGRISNDNNIF